MIPNRSEISATGTKGDYAEYKAGLWLMEQGHEVFRNMFSNGPIDLIGRSPDGTITLYDVKTSDGTRGKTRTPEQEEMGVQLIMYTHITDSFHLVKHRGTHEEVSTGHRDKQQPQLDLVLCNTGR